MYCALLHVLSLSDKGYGGIKSYKITLSSVIELLLHYFMSVNLNVYKCLSYNLKTLKRKVTVLVRYEEVALKATINSILTSFVIECLS
jgi:hypothetical protein